MITPEIAAEIQRRVDLAPELSAEQREALSILLRGGGEQREDDGTTERAA